MVQLITTDNQIIKVIEAINNAEWSQESEIDKDDYTAEKLQSFLNIPNNVFIVAYLNTVFAGIASAMILTKPTGNRWLYIDEVDVCVGMQRKGVGTEIMTYLIQYAKDHSCKEVWLGTEYENTAAKALYSSLHPDEIQQFTGYTYKV